MNIINEIKRSNKTFIIAEIGQNHQGNLLTAKELIKIAKECGADCVKFQKTCLEEKFTKSALEAPYIGDNSWGKTYGEHKAYLEFSFEDFLELQAYAKEVGIIFTASAMDEKSLEFLYNIKVPFIKIGSGDSNNLLLIDNAAKLDVPLVLSTGMINMNTTERIYNAVSKHHKNFALLHCVSAYPTPYEEVNLKALQVMQSKFPDVPVGYSGHELGTHISVAAVAMGAKIIERHITLDKNQKGSDHKCSLEPSDLRAFVQQIRTLEAALGQGIKKMQPSEEECYKKLGKSLVYAKCFPSGHALSYGDIKVKVAVPKGIDAAGYEGTLGRVLRCSVKEDDGIQWDDFVQE